MKGISKLKVSHPIRAIVHPTGEYRREEEVQRMNVPVEWVNDESTEADADQQQPGAADS